MFTDNFLYRLLTEYSKMQKSVYLATQKTLNVPRIELTEMNNKWGDWSESKRLIRLNIELFKKYEWDAILYVFRHEVAHQIVNEIFGFNEGNPHGEHFSIACKILGIPDNVCASVDFLKGYKSVQEESSLVDKIRKLYIKGNDKGATEEEQVLFMNKACQLMDKYNIKLTSIIGSENVYLRKQITSGYERFPVYLHDIARIVSKFYHVQSIQCTYYIWEGNKRKKMACMEMFGDSTNLEVGEYVFDALLNQADILYNEFKKNHKAVPGRKISKNAYIRGLMNGYEKKMLKYKEGQELSMEETGLMHLSDKMLKDLFEKEYRVRYTKNGSNGLGYSNGQADGYKMNVGSGVKSQQNGYLLC